MLGAADMRLTGYAAVKITPCAQLCWCKMAYAERTAWTALIGRTQRSSCLESVRWDTSCTFLALSIHPTWRSIPMR